MLQRINAFVFTLETRYAAARRTFFPTSREGAPHYGHTLQNRDHAQTECRVYEAPDPSAELAAVIGSEAVPRTEVTKKIWDYIKKHNLQDASNKRNINADAKLRPIFGKDQVTMFELTKLVNAHLK